jgi:hypothetical protein
VAPQVAGVAAEAHQLAAVDARGGLHGDVGHGASRTLGRRGALGEPHDAALDVVAFGGEFLEVLARVCEKDAHPSLLIAFRFRAVGRVHAACGGPLVLRSRRRSSARVSRLSVPHDLAGGRPDAQLAPRPPERPAQLLEVAVAEVADRGLAAALERDAHGGLRPPRGGVA